MTLPSPKINSPLLSDSDASERSETAEYCSDVFGQLASALQTGIPNASAVVITIRDDVGRPVLAGHAGRATSDTELWEFGYGSVEDLVDVDGDRVIHRDDIGAVDAQPRTAFVIAAMKNAIRSASSLPLSVASVRSGSINVFSNRSHAFQQNDEKLLAVVAAVASSVLTMKSLEASNFIAAQAPTRAIQDQQAIERAKGVLMARFDRLDSDGALRLLEATANAEQCSTAKVAAGILAVGENELHRVREAWSHE